MKQLTEVFSSKIIGCLISLFLFAALTPSNWAQQAPLCLDGFCIGQTIQNARFDKTLWILPKEGLLKKECSGIGCQPENAFRGYSSDEQKELAEVLSWKYGLNDYNVISNSNLEVLRHYKYECNLSARSLGGQRRFLGIYRSIPSQYLTVVGLRLINGELTIYRIARQYPYQNQAELISLAKQLQDQYGSRILLYDYLSDNAYSDVIKQQKDGWFGRSTLFNPTDLSDNAAEIVLIDPATRNILESSSMPESGEIDPLPMKIPLPCNRSLPVQ